MASENHACHSNFVHANVNLHISKMWISKREGISQQSALDVISMGAIAADNYLHLSVTYKHPYAGRKVASRL